MDGNNLEAEGATALLTQLAEAAYLEGKERERLKAEKMAAAVVQAQGESHLKHAYFSLSDIGAKAAASITFDQLS